MTLNGPAYYCSALLYRRFDGIGPFCPDKEPETFKVPTKNDPCDLGKACFVCNPRLDFGQQGPHEPHDGETR